MKQPERKCWRCSGLLIYEHGICWGCESRIIKEGRHVVQSVTAPLSYRRTKHGFELALGESETKQPEQELIRVEVTIAKDDNHDQTT